MYEGQPILPGLEEYDSQPALPFEDALNDGALLDALDTLHTNIDTIELAGHDAELLDTLRYEHLGKLAIERLSLIHI